MSLSGGWEKEREREGYSLLPLLREGGEAVGATGSLA